MTLKKLYMTVSESAKEIGISRQTLSRWIAQGKIKTETVGREKLIAKEQLHKYVRYYKGENAKSFVRMMNNIIGDIIKQQHYSKDDLIKPFGDDYIVTKVDGTMEKVILTGGTLSLDNDKKTIKIELKDIIRKPYKKEGKKKK